MDDKAPRYPSWFVPNRASQKKGVSCCQPAILSLPNDPTDRSLPGTWLSPRPCGVHRCWFSHSRPGNFSGSKATRAQVIDPLMEPRQEACAVALWLRARPPAEHSLLWLAMPHGDPRTEFKQVAPKRETVPFISFPEETCHFPNHRAL